MNTLLQSSPEKTIHRQLLTNLVDLLVGIPTTRKLLIPENRPFGPDDVRNTQFQNTNVKAFGGRILSSLKSGNHQMKIPESNRSKFVRPEFAASDVGERIIK